MDNRIGIAALALSAAALVGLAVDEGYSGKAYPDPVHGTRVPTFGFGSTAGVKMGDTITPVPALQRKLREVKVFEGRLQSCIKAPLYQREYDAYVNLAYNIGPTAFCNGSIPRKLNATPPDYAGACDAILNYWKAGDYDCRTPGNKVCSGLWDRRLRLHKQCFGVAP